MPSAFKKPDHHVITASANRKTLSCKCWSSWKTTGSVGPTSPLRWEWSFPRGPAVRQSVDIKVENVDDDDEHDDGDGDGDDDIDVI